MKLNDRLKPLLCDRPSMFSKRRKFVDQTARRFGSVFFALIALLLLNACQTPMSESFARLHVGMDKGEVLDIMGAPQRTQRWRGLDRWTYIGFDQHDRFEKEIQFKEGHSIYLGDRVPPAISADQQDKINDMANLEVQKNFEKARDDARQGLEQYEKNVRGSPSDSDTELIVPSYERVR